MPLIRSPIWNDPRVKPPYGAVEIDWSHPLTQRLSFCLLASESAGWLHDLVHRYRSTVTVPNWRPTPDGLAAYVAAFPIETGAYQLPTATGGPWTAFAVTWLHALPSAPNGEFWEVTNTTTIEGWAFQVRANEQAWATSVRAGGFESHIMSPAITVLPSRWALCAAFENAIIRLYSAQGFSAQPTYTATETSSSVPATLPDSATTFATSRNGSEQRGVLGYYWKRALNDAEVRWLFAEPYAFFRPIVRRRWFVPAAGTPVSNAVSLSWEGLAGIRPATVVPWESVGATPVSSAVDTPWEGLSSMSRTAPMPWEALAGVSVPTSAPWEALITVTPARSAGWEALAGTSAAPTTSWEAVRAVSAAVGVSWEATGAPVTRAIAVPWEAGGGAAPVIRSRRLMVGVGR